MCRGLLLYARAPISFPDLSWGGRGTGGCQGSGRGAPFRSPLKHRQSTNKPPSPHKPQPPLPPKLPAPRLSREVLVMVMRKHQRYFPVFGPASGSTPGGELSLPCFDCNLPFDPLFDPLSDQLFAESTPSQNPNLRSRPRTKRARRGARARLPPKPPPPSPFSAPA